MPSTDSDKLIKSRFKHAIADPEIRNQLLWDDTDMTLNQMIQKAQQFEELRGCKGAKPKRTLRTTDACSETSQLKKQIKEFQKQIANSE